MSTDIIIRLEAGYSNEYRHYHLDGATVSPDPSCLSLQYLCCSSLCVGGLGSVCYIWSTSPVLFGVLCEFKRALSNSRRT